MRPELSPENHPSMVFGPKSLNRIEFSGPQGGRVPGLGS